MARQGADRRAGRGRAAGIAGVAEAYRAGCGLMAPHLAPNWERKPDLVSPRNGFGEGMLALGEKNKNVVALCADLTESTRLTAFKEKYPDRFVEMGVAEQNMATVAAGMALMGKVPFIASFAVFSPGRNWEQIRTTICYNDVPEIGRASCREECRSRWS